jgi:hypothetical protein
VTGDDVFRPIEDAAAHAATRSASMEMVTRRFTSPGGKEQDWRLGAVPVNPSPDPFLPTKKEASGYQPERADFEEWPTRRPERDSKSLKPPSHRAGM